MKITGNKKRPEQYVEEAKSGLTRESFAAAFRGFSPVQNIRMSKDQMDGFFAIADDYLRRKVAAKAMAKDRPKVLQDYRGCKSLMAGTERKLRNVKAYVQKSVTKERTSTVLAARYTIRHIERLEKTFEDWRYEIKRWEFKSKMYSPQPLGNEFMIELERYIADEFPRLDKDQQNALIGATMAGAGMYSARALSAEGDPLERIAMKRYRAEKYYRKMYVDGWSADFEEPGRVYLNVGSRRKKKAAAEKGRKP